ncbi:phosphate acyltransferase PlsX [Adlercreutzia sp. ZJ304]|uniref:phosphate acyltransferase PlsX n=1 Tax=Adlercreutzia sp. ZJ304 TaxID=2709791 RepID=UPI0013EA809B|nr:phosphate acyltransferase PlsX [Adlercreutzia sp. ZJ304]
MSDKVTIAIDAMGGDYAPETVLEGTALALAEDSSLNVIMCGPAGIVESYSDANSRCDWCGAEETISMGEHPANAVRKKKNSSIVVGCNLVRDGKAQGFFSAGSTGACLAAATLIIGRIRGIKRPALVQVLPAAEKPCLLVDVGANSDCKPEYLVQFAQMASVYAKDVYGVANPVVGLLNIGEEDSKGDALAQKAHKLMLGRVEGFKGNCEPGDMLAGKFDVVVTDGFTGNIALKTIEATSKLLFGYIKDAINSGTKEKIGAILIRDSLRQLKQNLSPETYGGSPLLGVKGACVIGHGASSAVAVKNGILVCARSVRGNAASIIEKTVDSTEDMAEGV